MPDTVPPSSAAAATLAARSVSIDFEIDPRDGRARSFAGVRRLPAEFGGARELAYCDGNLSGALADLDLFSDGADFVLGHNVIEFDLRHLEALAPDSRLLQLPAIDTLWLNPLAFPANPYHRLVKHYKDGALRTGEVSDPLKDAHIALDLFAEQCAALAGLHAQAPDLVRAYHFLATADPRHSGFDAVFSAVRGESRPSRDMALSDARKFLQGRACANAIEPTLAARADAGWAMAFAISWISVAGGDSVLSPWVRHQFPGTNEIVRMLRDTPCGDARCGWCRSQTEPSALLKRWFGHDSFRPEPKGPDGRSLQETVVADAIAKNSVIGILPTGTGKSLCYQLPALSQFDRTGALTVVISPLVALMSDQVAGMQRQGIGSCTTINGTLSLPERQEALDQVRLGNAAILLIAPEQLRNPSVRSVLELREIGYWVFDEAHCVSKWGHDFRPDYRYAARYLKERFGKSAPPPVVALTATAKPDVIGEMADHFSSVLGLAPLVRDGGMKRDNLVFDIFGTSSGAGRGGKAGVVADLVNAALPEDGKSGAIVYCATRSGSESLAADLRARGHATVHYHGGLGPTERREAQEHFLEGRARVVAATNAFGMGIDKPDVRLVVHADIPGSLENYFQEAGRAGRDGQPARCVLLYDPEDVERQFGLSARNRLEPREIRAVHAALRRIDQRTGGKGEVVATSGEILREEQEREFERDSATDDTRVRTSISCLEEAELVKREENRTQVFPSSLRIRTRERAMALIARSNFDERRKAQLEALYRHIADSPRDEGISTDEIAGRARLSHGQLRRALSDLEALGIASNDAEITAFVDIGIENSSQRRFAAADALERDLVGTLRELAPDMKVDETSQLSLKSATQALRDAGHESVRPDIVESVIRGFARDGRTEGAGKTGGSLNARKTGRDRLRVTLNREWDEIAGMGERRRKAGAVLLASLCASAGKTRGKDIQVATTFGALTAALSSDAELLAESPDLPNLLDRAILWLHERGIATLGKGLTIFRPAMTVGLEPGSRKFADGDFAPLKIHYDEQIYQIHVMHAFAERGLESVEGAIEFAEAHFALGGDEFRNAWLPETKTAARRQTTPQTWRRIVDSLGNRTQQAIVTDERTQTNVLVLAGPGSGKTRVLVHRIAFLIRASRQDPRGILALTYNRHAAAEIRRRLRALVGEDARRVTIATCHGFAMGVVGASFASQADRATTAEFDVILKRAVELLRGDGLPRDEAEALRDTLIEGYRWILVDEYQDIGLLEYDLIAAIAGRSVEDADRRLSLFAVGDDDQNIYSFRGASVEFIRRFEEDYRSKPAHLVENYRSTANIVAASNRAIAPAAARMKADRDIQVDKSRRNEKSGGALERADKVGRGRVQILSRAGDSRSQAVLAVDELLRLSRLIPDWNWSGAAVVARQWKLLDPVRSLCEARGIPVQFAERGFRSHWRLRETCALVGRIRSEGKATTSVEAISAWLQDQPESRWRNALAEGLSEFEAQNGGPDCSAHALVDWIAEWCGGMRDRSDGLLLLTAHRAKGLEFDDVVVLDGGWDAQGKGEDPDAARRLFYVAMTRARRSLALLALGESHLFVPRDPGPEFLNRPSARQDVDISDCRRLYRVPGLREIDIGFASRLFEGNRSLSAIERLKTDARLELEERAGKLELVDGDGTTVGRMAKSYRPPQGARFVRASAHAILVRRKDDGKENAGEFADLAKRDEWHVVLPELVFER